MNYKVIFHEGEDVGLSTKVRVGRLSLREGILLIEGDAIISIPCSAIQSVELFRLHNTGRMLKVRHETGVLFIAVIRFMLFGYFAVGNFFANGRLKKKLQSIIDAHHCAQPSLRRFGVESTVRPS